MFAALKLPLILKPPSPSPAGFPGEEHVFLIFLVIYQTWGECFIDVISNTISSAAGSPRASSSSPPPGYPRVSPGAPEELARRLRVAEYFWLTTQASSVWWIFCAKQFWRRRKGGENKSFFHGVSKLFGHWIKNEFEDCGEGNLSLLTTDLTCQSIIM